MNAELLDFHYETLSLSYTVNTRPVGYRTLLKENLRLIIMRSFGDLPISMANVNMFPQHRYWCRVVHGQNKPGAWSTVLSLVSAENRRATFYRIIAVISHRIGH